MSESIIRVEHLVKKFGDFTAVNDISFEVKKGQVFAFLGPNGAGKSTTIKMLTTLLLPTSGEISLDGESVLNKQKEARETFGIVFQDPSLDDELTARENLEFHGVLYKVDKSLRRKRIEELLNYVELWDRKDDQVKTFSGGMKRRLEIARGLLHHPKIFFLDEPTQGLDPQTRNKIWEYIKALNKKEDITIFFTTHYMEEAEKIADMVAVIDHGKIVADGSPEELKKQTNKSNLEDAFLALTGKMIRDEEASGTDHMRMHRQMWGGENEMRLDAVGIMWLRQLKRYFRTRSRIVGSLGQPLLFLVALGFGFGPTFAKAGEGNYLQFLVPGVIGMSVLFTAIFSGIEVIWDKQFGFLKETLVAPISRMDIMLGRTLGGATVATMQGVIVLILSTFLGFRPELWGIVPAIGVMFLLAILFTALGTAIASKLEDMQGFQLIMNFLVMPLFFLSGALFPLNNAPQGLVMVAAADPMSYGIDALRHVLIGASHFGIGLDISILLLITVVLVSIGSYLFSKIQI